MGSATPFIAASKPLKEALKSANLLKSLKFNTLLLGQPGTGRHTLARLMMPDAPLVHGDDANLYTQIEKHPRLIVDRMEKIASTGKFFQAVKKYGVQIVAIAPEDFAEEYRAFFSVHIVLPPLAERPEDIAPLAEKFRQEVGALFGEGSEAFVVDLESVDLSENAFSLRRSVMLQYLLTTVDEAEIMRIMESHLASRMEEGEDLYRRLLYLYEVPLIRAGTKKYRSQLKMSQVFGLNRNTLRKKIQEWRRLLDEV